MSLLPRRDIAHSLPLVLSDICQPGGKISPERLHMHPDAHYVTRRCVQMTNATTLLLVATSQCLVLGHRLWEAEVFD